MLEKGRKRRKQSKGGRGLAGAQLLTIFEQRKVYIGGSATSPNASRSGLTSDNSKYPMYQLDWL
jgi:hypothetical protein